MLTGVASGLVIVFVLKDTAAAHTARHTMSPIVELVFAGLLIVAAVALAKGEGKRVRELYDERQEKKEKKDKKDKKPPRVAADAGEGNAWHTFVAGILLSFPGVSYLAALDRLIHLHYATAVTVLIVIGFNLVQNLLLEIPMLEFKIWPRETRPRSTAQKCGARRTAEIRCLGAGDTRRRAGDHKRHRPPVAMISSGRGVLLCEPASHRSRGPTVRGGDPPTEAGNQTADKAARGENRGLSHLLVSI